MIKKIVYDKSFEKRFERYKNGLPERKLYELRERIEIFKNNPFNSKLKTHKLKRKLKDYWAFSVSYSNRILFRFLDKEKVFFIDIGDHSIYK